MRANSKLYVFRTPSTSAKPTCGNCAWVVGATWPFDSLTRPVRRSSIVDSALVTVARHATQNAHSGGLSPSGRSEQRFSPRSQKNMRTWSRASRVCGDSFLGSIAIDNMQADDSMPKIELKGSANNENSLIIDMLKILLNITELRQ